ncbi:hypothetical protein DP114_17550 [Brasilonema sennae CENA114]|uniref:Uncharacterized protein n=1 Tax=Brasilonema sennae CENA114 TaxID=415709 RepID=A0A856MII8_9CYAN|nr:hypothetical protein [Brasilonema sennae]QDL09461.1 hypothetical protein DP114_17550 [Brasilonema sennae CENA114]
MKDSTNRNGLEITETVSVAGSVAGSVFAVFSQQLIYAAAPLSLALSLSLINRRRFEQALQENITAVSSEMGTRVTHVGQQLSAQMQSVRTSVETLSAVPIPAPFDPTNLEQQIEELKTALIHTKQITSQSATKQEIEDFNQKIKQLQAYVISLTEAFNQRSELEQIEQLSQTTTQLQQHVSALPPIPAPFDPTGLEQQIQQLQAGVSSLTEAFNQRSELQQIEQLSQSTAQVQEHVSALPPIPAPFDPTGLEQQIQQLQACVSSLTEAFNQRSELQQIEQLSQSTAQVQEHVSALPPIQAPFDPTGLEQQIQQLRQSTAQVQEHVSALPPIPAPFDPTGLEQQIQQLQAYVSSLTEAFNQRSELQQIEQLSQSTAQVQEHVSALPPYFDTSDLKQEIQLIRAELQSLRQQVESSTPPAETVNGGQTGLAHPELNRKLPRLPQLFKSFAQMQHQLVKLQRLTAKSDKRSLLPKADRTTVPPQEQLSELSPITHRVASSNGTQLTTSLKNQRLSVEALMAMAEARGIGKEFQMVIQAAKKHHLTLNPWPTNLMVSPAAHLLSTARRNSSQCLFIISGQPAMDGKVRLWVSTHAIAKFYPVRQQTVTSLLGFDGWREMDKAQIEEFVASLNRLFEEASVLIKPGKVEKPGL